MTRLFVAAWPDEATRAVLGALPAPDEPGVRRVAAENWHVTLRFLGDCDADAVCERLAGSRLPSAVATLGPTVVWLGSQLVVPVAGVDALAATVADATSGLGDPPRQRFRGHLTVARIRRGAHPSLLGHPVEARFEIGDVALVRSDVTDSGSHYTTVVTFPAF